MTHMESLQSSCCMVEKVDELGKGVREEGMGEGLMNGCCSKWVAEGRSDGLICRHRRTKSNACVDR
jgi:hypothetical protein